jgi:23S rRNA (uracil1939-C5)-methyltransferase
MRLVLNSMMNAVEGRIDRLVVDPPRGGMDQKALAQLVALRTPVMAYVSCNPTTMARDLQTALDAGYVIEKVTPVDMFPQTYHVECVAKLRLQPAGAPPAAEVP